MATCMAPANKRSPIATRPRSANATQTAGASRVPEIEVDASLIADGLEIESSLVQAHLHAGRIRVLSERGIGDDLGTFRVTFYLGSRSLRLLLDASGTVLDREQRTTGNAPLPRGTSQPNR